MVARSPNAKPDRQTAATLAALNPALVRETVKKVRSTRPVSIPFCGRLNACVWERGKRVAV